MSLLEPFSGMEIPLPHQSHIQRYSSLEMDEHIFIQKMALSLRPSETLDFVLMVVCGNGTLAYWRLGDKEWNLVKGRKGRFLDVIHSGDKKIYATSFPGIVWGCNLAGNNNHAEAHIIMHCKSALRSYPDYPSVNLYVVKAIDGALLFISRAASPWSYLTKEMRVYEVDIEMISYKEIHSLGSMAVFVGHNSTLALNASKIPGGVIKANHIYFTDDDYDYYFFEKSPKGGGQDMGVFNLETKTVEPFYPGGSRCAAKFPHPYGLPHLCFRKL